MFLAIVVLLSVLVTVLSPVASATYESSPFITKLNDDLNIDYSKYFSSAVTQKLPEGIEDDEEISLIIQTNQKTLLDAYDASNSTLSFSDFCQTEEAKQILETMEDEYKELTATLDAKNFDYVVGERYDTLLSGFEITVKAGIFEDVCKALGSNVDVIVGEVYEPADAKVVTNNVNVYDTGIFKSEGSKFDGSGMVVAVLDTGCDYTHTVFSVNNFTSTKLGLTFEELETLVDKTVASTFHGSLTADDVYLNIKIPYAYDYADKDPDVMPISNEHGTHVAGIIAGKDADDKEGDRITGVAPNAQLAIMKVFSDFQNGAKTSWMLAALEDCVNLDVDVINMSLGSDCGFSRDYDNAKVNEIYESIRDRGISLIVSAGNSYNSTHGSQKNGNLGLTSNPDSATVGSPSTYCASLSIASIDGVPTHYIKFGDKIIYYIEASDRVSEEKDFVEDLLGTDNTSLEVEYVLIPGIGCEADYLGIDVTGKIVLVARGNTTFEEKANIAEDMGARGVIIYNNVSGDIKMTVGDTKIAVCSISQDDGEMLAANKTGKLTISKQQAAGPFMSDFSSWGPSPNLEIKPEITAHGGSILSAVPGQGYERMSGTSMAAPNNSGVATLLRQYVIERFFNDQLDEFGNLSVENRVKVTAMVNRLMMSTADIIINKNGLPYSVRKQGSGLVNLTDSTSTDAYIITYNRNDNSIMDKTKIELGDDPQKNGIYTLKFSVENFGTSTLSYNISTYVMTEGVSDTLTTDGKTTVTEEGYILNGAIITVTGDGVSGNTVTVGAGSTATVTVTITLSDADKKYLNDSFANGMFVEGYVMLNSTDSSKTDLNVPYLAFYGDWTEAPIFDIDYFATNKDELDDSIDLLDKTLPDAYATRAIGRLYSDYISYLGGYYYIQKPGTKKIAADRKYVSISNQEKSVNSIDSVWAGALRNCEKVVITITDDATGEVVFTRTEEGIRKSRGNGANIYGATIDIEFSAAENNLKNNSAYTVTLQGYVNYGDGGEATNDNNTFTFPLVTDFQAPIVEDCEFYYEYDQSTKTNRLYAKIAVYDNHYSMAMIPGYVYKETDTESEKVSYNLHGFDQYPSQIYSSFNSTSYVVYELTDYIQDIKENAHNRNSFTVSLVDYALNQSVYEITLPNNLVDLYFENANGEVENAVTLSPNQVYSLNPKVYPETEWAEFLYYESSDESVVRVVNGSLVAVGSGTATVTAYTSIPNKLEKLPGTSLGGQKKTATIDVTVLAEGDEGFKRYDKPVVNRFDITGYETIKAYYMMSNEDRDIGLEDSTQVFYSSSYNIKLFPSETVKLIYELIDYFGNTEVVFESSSEDIVTVDEDGTIKAISEGFAAVTINVLADKESTYYSKTVNIEVKKPYTTQGPMLMHYYGTGDENGKVVIPETLGVTTIYEYAFSNCKYIEKDLNAGDVITEEDPLNTKPSYIGDEYITEIVIPEGVKSIGNYAFAGLTKLEKITLPKSLVNIGRGAFEGCTSLTLVAGLENVKFINAKAFYNCDLTDSYSLNSVVAISDNAFENNKNLTKVYLPASAQSIGSKTFKGCESLNEVVFNSEKIKLGEYTFENCTSLTKISINAAVISKGTFAGCTSLTNVTIGKDVAQIGEYAFANTKIEAFDINEYNATYKVSADNTYLTNAAGDKIVLIAPAVESLTVTDSKITTIGLGAASGNESLKYIYAPYVVRVESYAFAGCKSLEDCKLGNLTMVGDYSFYETNITALPKLADNATSIGNYSFAKTPIYVIDIPAKMTIGNYAFSECPKLATVKIGDGVTIGEYAFYYAKETKGNSTSSSYVENDQRYYYFIFLSPIKTLKIGDNVTIGKGAFMGNASIEVVELGSGAVIGDYAFYNATALKTIDLSKAVSIGMLAFSGDMLNEFFLEDGKQTPALEPSNDNEIFRKYRYRTYAPALTTIDLSAVTSIGKGAFIYCESLEEVILGDAVTVIADYAFTRCKKLTSIDLSKVTEIGEYAFAESGISGSITLSEVTTIGNYAFSDCYGLTEVVLGENATKVGNYAFYYCESIAKISGIENLTDIGDYAFAYTAITEANLESAVNVGDHAFMKNESTKFTVTLGENIETLGENPFANCIIKPISTTQDVMFNDKKVETKTLYTFDLNEYIRIIDGSIYRVVPNGLELITFCGSEKEVKVADNTVRISDMAFSGTDITSVILPYTLKSIGHKAFYGCDNLNVVTLTSYNAPILEEMYDYSYFSDPNNWPTKKSGLTVSMGLDLIQYHMWTVSSSPNNVLYGANFVDYVGKLEDKLVMVRPSNGLNYDSYIFDTYFSVAVDGKPAADAITLEAIDLINKLPDTVSLSDEQLVILARQAYDKVINNEQRALVTEYAKLTKAEKRIIDLKYLAQEEEKDEPTDNNDNNTVDEGNEKMPAIVIALIVVGSVLGAALIACGTIFTIIVIRRKKATSTEANVDNNTANKASEEKNVATENSVESKETEENKENE